MTIVRTPEGRYRISSIYDHGDEEVYPVLSDVRVEGNTFTRSYLIPSTGWRKTSYTTKFPHQKGCLQHERGAFRHVHEHPPAQIAQTREPLWHRPILNMQDGRQTRWEITICLSPPELFNLRLRGRQSEIPPCLW